MNKLKGGLSDNMKPEDLAKKHDISIKSILSQLKKGIQVEKEHTDDEGKAKEIAMDHIAEDPKYYDKLKKIEEPKESMGADAAGSFEPAFNSSPVKRKINTIHNLKENEEIGEAMTADAAGPYDVPFGGGGKNPLKIGGEKSIKSSRAVKDKNFPKYGGPKGVFIKIKEKCKKFPYCNQGDINALELLEIEGLKESILKASKMYGIPYSEMEKTVLNEITKIFIK